jgi:hypothetical protein
LRNKKKSKAKKIIYYLNTLQSGGVTFRLRRINNLFELCYAARTPDITYITHI